jgi:ABC-type antimicrobial peptide transport system permease subunit
MGNRQLSLGEITENVFTGFWGGGRLWSAAIGAAVGLGGAIALGRAIEGALFEVGGTDVATLVCVSAILVAAAVLASYLPARRASRLDPVQALRQE